MVLGNDCGRWEASHRCMTVAQVFVSTGGALQAVPTYLDVGRGERGDELSGEPEAVTAEHIEFVVEDEDWTISVQFVHLMETHNAWTLLPDRTRMVLLPRKYPGNFQDALAAGEELTVLDVSNACFVFNE